MNHLKRAFEGVLVVMIVDDLADLFFFTWWIIRTSVSLPIISFLDFLSLLRSLAYCALIILFFLLMRECEEPIRKKYLKRVVLSQIIPLAGFHSVTVVWLLSWPIILDFLLHRLPGAILTVGLLFYLYYLWRLAQQWNSSEATGILLLSYGIIQFTAWFFMTIMITMMWGREKTAPIMVSLPLFVFSIVSTVLSILIYTWLFQNADELVGLVSGKEIDQLRGDEDA